MLRHLALSLALAGAFSVPAQKLAITFDDLPAHGDLPANVTRQQVADSILATLKREHMPPVYGFINAQSVADEPETIGVLQAWHDNHQPLGNHTWSHPNINDVSAETFLTEIDKNEATLKRFDRHGDHLWFRYPFLAEGDTVEKHRAVRAGLKARGYKVAEVTMDFEDYLWNDPYARCADLGDTAALKYLHDSYLETAERYMDIDRVLSHQVFGKDIPYVLLMHIGGFDAKMLPELIALYRRHGFRFVSMPAALKDKDYRVDPEGADEGGGSYTELLMTIRDMEAVEKEKPYAQLESVCRSGVPAAAAAPAQTGAGAIAVP